MIDLELGESSPPELHDAIKQLYMARSEMTEDIVDLYSFRVADKLHNRGAQAIQRTIFYMATEKIFPHPVRTFIYPAWTTKDNWYHVIYYTDCPRKRIIGDQYSLGGPLDNKHNLIDTLSIISKAWTAEEVLAGWKKGGEDLKRLRKAVLEMEAKRGEQP